MNFYGQLNNYEKKMADWPPVTPTLDNQMQEREKLYLQLVDMFVDIVEPDIIQMVLQNRNWNVDEALEDIMVLSNTSYQANSKRKDSQCGLTSPKVSSKSNPTKTAAERNEIQDKPEIKANDQSFVKYSSLLVPDQKKVDPSTNQHIIDQYNYIKTIRNPIDRIVMLIKDGIKVMVILRGPPGSGKSHLARRLLTEAGIDFSVHHKHIFSTDDFFVQNNRYTFVAELLSQAHEWNQRKVAAAVRNDLSPVIVDNTNTQAWEMRIYAEWAVSGGYDLEILEPDTYWLFKDGELAKRNVHGVPKAKIRQMIERYERNITPSILMRQFNLRYSLSKAPPQSARNCKWKDKLSSQRNNKPKKKKNDFNSKPESNLKIFNSVSQSLQFDPSKFIQDPSLFEPCFKGNVFSSSPVEEDIPSIFESKEEINMADTYKNKNGESFSNTDSKESLSAKLFENLMNNASSFMKSISVPSASSGSVQTHGDYYSNGTNESTIRSSKDSFDFMAETKKLLEALNRPVAPNPFIPESKIGIETESGQSLSPLENKSFSMNPALHLENALEKILVCKEDEILLPENDLSSFIFTSSNALNGNVKENKIVANDLIEEIIGGVVNERENTKQACFVNSTNDNGYLWDYVLVSDNNTFIYQRKDSQPLPTDTTALVEAKFSDFNGTTQEKTEDFDSSVGLQSSSDYLKFTDNEENRLLEVEFPNMSLNEQTKLNRIQEIVSEPNSLEKDVFFLKLNEIKGSEIHSNLKTSDIQENNSCYFVENSQCNKKSDSVTESKRMEEAEVPMESSKTSVTGIMNNILNSIPSRNEGMFASSGSSIFSDNLKEEDNYAGVESMSKSTEVKNGNNIPVSTDNLNSWFNAFSQSDLNLGKDAFQPKPSRNLKRQNVSAKIAASAYCQPQSLEQENSSYLGNWDTVSNPVESWGMNCPVESNYSIEVPPILPQRSSPQHMRNRKMTDSSTNTNYLDFSLVNEENPIGVKVLKGNIDNIISVGIPEVKQSMVETLFLDKSTMTVEETSASSYIPNYDISQITSLFPNIPEKYIRDMVERCQGDIDWAVDLLLDSEHNVALTNNEPEDSLQSSSCEEEMKEEIILPAPNDHNCDEVKQDNHKSPSKEQADLKKCIENSIVFNKSHYSEKVLKVLKRKHPEYANLIEIQTQTDEKSENISSEEMNSLDANDDETESSKSSSEVESEDDTLELVINTDLILQLQQKFGTSSLPDVASMAPLVKLPVSFARQLFGYILDSLQSDMEEQQSRIEEMIARDEEVARLLQQQDQGPQFQEVMDMEIALAMHKADQEEWKEKINETVAAKLSKNILLEKFPQMDPKMLMDVLQAHNYSLHDTIDSLTLALGVPSEPSSESRTQEPKEETFKEPRMTTVLVSDDMNVNLTKASTVKKSSTHVDEAQVHREQAASYYSLRMECLNKAQEAFRSGNKAVATYYSQLAQIHKDRQEHSNSQAAACLFSSHKMGKNTLDLHFLHVREAEVVLDMFLDEVVTYITDHNKRHQVVFLITGRGLRSVGGVSRIKPMVQRKLHGRGIRYNDVNPGMLSAIVRETTPLSYTL